MTGQRFAKFLKFHENPSIDSQVQMGGLSDPDRRPTGFRTHLSRTGSMPVRTFTIKKTKRALHKATFNFDFLQHLFVSRGSLDG
jgi:hypothetical protein